MAVVLGAFVPDTVARWRGVTEAAAARQLGVAAEARRLAARLERVAAAVGDAEERAARGDEVAARWLGTARAAAYEADAAADRCWAVAQRHGWGREQKPSHGVQALPWLLSSCCDADEPRRDVAGDLKNVNQKLQAILKEQRRLQLDAPDADHAAVRARTVPWRRESEPSEADIVGARIEDDAHRLVRRLTDDDGNGQAAACTVVAIVGPGGIGKATLAKVVYESERARRSFRTRAWVRLFGGYTEAGLLSQVIESAGGETTGDESVADLEASLTGLVANRRFLLVLDGVCHGGVWEDMLRGPLQRASRGSKVLVTARHGSIAREMGAAHVHRVRRLDADDGWLLLRVAACVADDESEAGAGELRAVGERLVEKCGGVPLAIRAVAGVLRTREASAGEWTTVLASPAWSAKWLPDGAMRPLYLCYDDLPCHLKQCFLYCSLFPSDVVMDRRRLLQQWISEGFVQARGDAGVEEAAEQYYDELVGRNLLQPAEADAYSCTQRCTMHDMLRALAQLLSKGEGLNGDAQAQRPPDAGDASFAPPRRFSFPRRNLTAIPEKILKLEWLRTLLLQNNPLTTEGNIFTRLHHLRILDLSETGIDLIPETLGNLIYLRFLNLSQTRIQAVPESIANLWTLKFLLLRGCTSLHALPKGIEHLRELTDLDLAGTVIDNAAFRVGQLTSLTSLRCFAATTKEARAAQDRSGWPLDELKNLCRLRTLHVQKLEKATCGKEAAEMVLAGKTCLRELELSCSATAMPFQTPTVVQEIEDIFEELNPPQCLESLKIANYFGTKFPIWLSATVLMSLRHLDIIGCSFCQSLPPLGRLPELRSLYIADSSALSDTDTEFIGSDQHHQVPFPKLENLHLQGLRHLKTWKNIKEGAMPCLQALQLESCPDLRHLPSGLRHVKSLMELRIVDMPNLEAVEDIAALRELSVWNAPNLKKISDMPSLEDLSICHCPTLQTVENVDRLRVMHIFDHELQEMPRWIKAHASNLHSLDITCKVELLKRCLVNGPDWPLIKDIARVRGYSTGSSYIYYSNIPYNFESSVNIQENHDMEEKAANSDNVDSASTQSRTVNKDDVSVSPSGTGSVEINGFFDSKVDKTGSTRTEDNLLHRNTEMFTPKLTRRRMHTLEEVVPEDGEVEEDTGPTVVFPGHRIKSDAVVEKNRPVITDHANHDAVASPVLATDTHVTKSVASIGHNIVREGSPAITITETGKNLNVSLIQGEEYTSNIGDADSGFGNKGREVHDTANKMPSIASAKENIPEMVENLRTQVAKRESKVIGDDRPNNDLPDCSAPLRQLTSQKGKDESASVSALAGADADVNATAPSIPSSDMVDQKHLDKVNETAASAISKKNASPMPETAKNTIHSPSKPMHAMSDHAADINQAVMKTEATMPNGFSSNAEVNEGLTDDSTLFSINVNGDGVRQPPPKVYTAAWADTDTDTLRARFLSSMERYRRMAASRRHRRRHRNNGNGSERRWTIGPVLVGVLSFVSVVQLLFIIWLCRRLLDQA